MAGFSIANLLAKCAICILFISVIVIVVVVVVFFVSIFTICCFVDAPFWQSQNVSAHSKSKRTCRQMNKRNEIRANILQIKNLTQSLTLSCFRLFLIY